MQLPLAAFGLAVGISVVQSAAGEAQRLEDQEPNRGGTLRTEARDPSYALERLHPADGYVIELFASEQDFPIGNPVSLTFDAKGRLWVATMPTYPQRLPDEEPRDQLVILEDRDRDGRADHHTIFAEGLHLPTGFELGDGGVYVAQQPNLMFLEDTDGDDRADRREILLHGFGTEDSHHSISAFTWDPGGALYFQEGTFHHSQIETPYGPVRLVDAGVFRFEPKRHWLEVFVSYPFANPWGHVFDRWGQSFLADASGGANYFGTAISGNAIYPEKRKGMKVFTSVVRPTAGCELVRSRHFPDEVQGNFLINNTIGFQGIKQHRVIEEGSGFTSEEVEPLLYSTDINFRPVDLQFGPDGALYVVDWFNPLVGHMQYSLRDERRDSGHGRIWRIRHATRPLVDPFDADAASIDELIEALGRYEDRTRYRARGELRTRDHEEVLSAAGRWLSGLGEGEEAERRKLEILWLHQSLDVVDESLLEQVLSSPEPRARAAATRVLRFWRDRITSAHHKLEQLVHDPFPRVRLEAVLALSYLPSTESTQAALGALQHPMDYYLDYVLGETIDTLRPWWEPDLDGLLEEVDRESGLFLLARLDDERLAGLEPRAVVLEAQLSRRQSAETQRRLIESLARISGRAPAEILVESLSEIDALPGIEKALAQSLGERLVELGAPALRGHRDALLGLASSGRLAATRIAARRGLLVLGDSSRPAERADELVEWLAALRGAPEGVRRDLEEELWASISSSSTVTAPMARTVRIEAPGPGRRLSLEEVEIWSAGDNVAIGASATQSTTVADGFAPYLIDGVTGAGAPVASTGASDETWMVIELERPAVIDRVHLRAPTRGADDLVVSWIDGTGAVVYRQSGVDWGRADSSAVGVVSPEREIEKQTLLTLAALPDSGTRAARHLLSSLMQQPEQVQAALVALSELTSSDAADRDEPNVLETGGPLENAELEALAAFLTDYLNARGPDELSAPPVVAARVVAQQLLGGSPADANRAALAAALDAHRVTVVPIVPIPHQMLFDVVEFTVPAGRPVEIRLDNRDVMPHNVVITRPGGLEDVGKMAESMAAENPLRAERAQYVPRRSSKLLFASQLIAPGASGALTFLAPREPGRYPFVCTFPGHWILMNGIMTVIDGIDPDDATIVRRQTLTSSIGAPETVRQFVRDWTLEELEGDADALDQGSVPTQASLAVGRSLFGEIGCSSCHQRDGVGGEVGPTLDDAVRQYGSVDLLRHILEPSELVDEAYETTLVETDDGRFFSGLVTDEDETTITLQANPLAPEERITFDKSELSYREKSELSPMPSGLLSTLTREEILDLLRYLRSDDTDVR